MSEPITVNEMATHVQHAVNRCFPEIADAPWCGAFKMTTPATGQRFLVIITEVAGWSDRMDRELTEVTREATP